MLFFVIPGCFWWGRLRLRYVVEMRPLVMTMTGLICRGFTYEIWWSLRPVSIKKNGGNHLHTRIPQEFQNWYELMRIDENWLSKKWVAHQRSEFSNKHWRLRICWAGWMFRILQDPAPTNHGAPKPANQWLNFLKKFSDSWGSFCHSPAKLNEKYIKLIKHIQTTSNEKVSFMYFIHIGRTVCQWGSLLKIPDAISRSVPFLPAFLWELPIWTPLSLAPLGVVAGSQPWRSSLRPCDTAKPLSFIKYVLVDLAFLHLCWQYCGARISENNEFQILAGDTNTSITVPKNPWPGTLYRTCSIFF